MKKWLHTDENIGRWKQQAILYKKSYFESTNNIILTITAYVP